ncbi:hypothetical protein ACWDAZ_24975, partial [Streptomyces sp. NPDC001215]
MDAFLLRGAGSWDIAALIPVVEEAGGLFSDLGGRRRADTGAALFAVPGLHRPLLDIVRLLPAALAGDKSACSAAGSGPARRLPTQGIPPW